MIPQPQMGRITSISVSPASVHSFLVTSDPDGSWISYDPGTTPPKPKLKWMFNKNLGMYHVHSSRIAFAPSDSLRAYELNDDSEVSVSTDVAGGLWKRSLQLGDARPWRALAVHPANPDLVIIGGLNRGNGSIFRTTNGGTSPGTWSAASGAPVNITVTDFEFDRFDTTTPMDVWGATAHVLCGTICNPASTPPPVGLLYSSDAGENWVARPLDPARKHPRNQIYAVAVVDPLPAFPAQSFLAATEAGLLHCVSGCDQPASWQDLGVPVTPPLINDVTFAMAAGNPTIWVGTTQGVLRGDLDPATGAVAWSQTAFPSTFPSGNATAIGTTRSRGEVLYAGYEHGEVYRTLDGGATAERIEGTQGGHPMETLAVIQGDDVYGGTVCQTGIQRYDGTTWFKHRMAYDPTEAEFRHPFHYVMRIVTVPGSPLIAYTTVDDLFKTTDGGVNWENLSETTNLMDGEHLHGLAVHPTNPAVVYVATGHGIWGSGNLSNARPVRIWKSTDGGDTWTDPPFDVGTVSGWTDGTGTKSTSLLDIAVSPLDLGPTGDDVYIGTFGHEQFPEDTATFGAGQGVLRSLDGGATWELVTQGLRPGGLSVAKVAMVVTGPSQVTTTIATLDGVYRMVGHQTLWDGPFYPPGTTDTAFEALAVDPSNPDVMYLGSAPVPQAGPPFPPPPANIFQSTDGGATWGSAMTMTMPQFPAWSVTSQQAFPRFRVRDIVVGQSRAYAAVEGAGIYVFADGCTSPPQAAFTASVVNAPAPQVVTFTSSSTPTGVGHSWTFGDGQSMNGDPVTHAFPRAGVYTVTLTVDDGAGCTDTATQLLYFWNDVPADQPDFVTAPGGLAATAWRGNFPMTRLFRYPDALPSGNTGGASGPFPNDLYAYGYQEFGNTVAVGRVHLATALGSTVLTGAGPGVALGPQVRGFFWAMGRKLFDYFAYGTLRYGVNVAAGDVDQDGAREILTGPGPGEVFGPHVRGWNYDGNAIAAIAKLSFFAYGTLKYGANVSSGDVDGDGYAEVLTGPGPSAAFPAHVRGFNYDDFTTTAIAKINFNAFDPVATRHGAKVAGGDLDGDGFDDILAGKGPTVTNDTGLASFDYGGVAISPHQPFAGAFPTAYGTSVAIGELELSLGNRTAEEALAGAGPDPTAVPRVRGLSLNTTVAPPRFETMTPDLNFTPYPPGSGPSPGYPGYAAFGANVAVAPLGEPLDRNTRGGTRSAHAGIVAAGEKVARFPHSTTVDFSLDPEALADINEWRSDAFKLAALADLELLRDGLFSMEVADAIATLAHAREQVALGLLNDAARESLLADLDELLAFYRGGLRSPAILARVPFPEEPPRQVETSPVAPLSAYVVSASPAPSGETASAISHLDLPTLAVLDRTVLEGTVKDLAISIPEGNVYTIRTTAHEHFDVGPCPVPCRRPLCIPREELPDFPPHVNPIPIPPPVRLCKRIHPEVHRLLDRLSGEPVSQELLAPVASSTPDDPRVLILTPTLANPSGPSKAYVSVASGIETETSCPSGGVMGEVVVVKDLAAMPGSDVAVIGQGLLYADLEPSPISGDPRIFAIYDCAIDAIDSATDTVQYLAIPGVGGDRLRGAEVAPGVHRLFALDTEAAVVTAYDLDAGSIAGQLPIPMVVDMEVTPNGRRLVVLTSDSRLVLVDAAALTVERTIEAGQEGSAMVHVAITADGTRALLSDEDKAVVEVVQIAPEVIADQVDGVATVVESVPDRAFIASPDLSRQRRNALLNKLAEVRQRVEEAEETVNPLVREALLGEAINKLENDVLKKMDGFYGGDAQNDWIKTEEGQRLLVPIVTLLRNRLTQEIPVPEGPPPIL